ncbi:hypothetical protein [Brevibacterium luteolum]|uniref:Uncharacterized protein n=1 Tax=Brevibacterium luteolum TaxID=199591 RepID=A0A849APW5_9MICO|nr:hypothetical protein [Brevibacterium luteolum]MBM7530511.1 hypothetical protein [Brevibacterium luteolum]NNG77905.1 hypothetical protein [Brevibacterium luteolum]
MRFAALTARLIIPAIWLGLIIAIDLIEAPLKFQAPGITIPLGLGIGRLVFTAMNIVEGVLAIMLIAAVIMTRQVRPAWTLLATITGIVLIKVAIVRPLLNARTEAVLNGTGAPGSAVHLVYIALDAVLFCVLAAFTWVQARTLVAPAAAAGAAPHAQGPQPARHHNRSA